MPARRYIREARVDEQLRRLEALPARRLVSEICVNEADATKRVVEETLVAVCRQLYRGGDEKTAWKIALVLARRVKSRIAVSLRQWRLDTPESQALELIDEIVSSLYDAVFDLTPKSQFWEIRFWVAFDRRLLTTVRRRRAEADRRVDFGVGDDEDSLEEIAGAQNAVGGAATLRVSDPETSAMIAEALGRLPQKVRTAFLLKYVGGMPEDTKTKDPSSTIAGVLGVTGRAVRNYLRRAETELALWRGDDADEIEGLQGDA